MASRRKHIALPNYFRLRVLHRVEHLQYKISYWIYHSFFSGIGLLDIEYPDFLQYSTGQSQCTISLYRIISIMIYENILCDRFHLNMETLKIQEIEEFEFFRY